MSDTTPVVAERWGRSVDPEATRSAPGQYHVALCAGHAGAGMGAGAHLLFDVCELPPNLRAVVPPGDVVAIWGHAWGPGIAVVRPNGRGHKVGTAVLTTVDARGKVVEWRLSALWRVDTIAEAMRARAGAGAGAGACATFNGGGAA